MRRLIVSAMLLLAATPAFAQFRTVDVRPFFLGESERYAAATTFNAVFQEDTAPLWGGGVDVVVHKRFFIDLAISHMSKDGQRAFLNNGEVFRLGIPLHVTSTPIEITGGYRFVFKKAPIIPYVGAGFGSYSYRETGDFATPGEDVDVRHAGFVAMGGVEFRIMKWLGITGDVQYTRVPGILGAGGISKDAGEDNFGGVGARVRVIVGR